jgi:hypothetical protein
LVNLPDILHAATRFASNGSNLASRHLTFNTNVVQRNFQPNQVAIIKQKMNIDFSAHVNNNFSHNQHEFLAQLRRQIERGVVGSLAEFVSVGST